MNELSLFTGIGGGLLGTKLLDWQCIGAVEHDEYCCKVLEQRIRDGVFEPFPIWQMDIREFNRRLAEKYRGVVDIVTLGFPCQPFSVAGKRQGDQDERNMWPATIECIRLVRPQYLLLENVPGLLVHKYVRRIYGDLAESGYTVPWDCVSAAFCGANHLRRRLWFVANLQSMDGTWSNKKENHRPMGKCQEHRGSLWWSTRPKPCRMDDGLPNGLDRLKSLGNAQVPLCVATVWKILSRQFGGC